MNINDYISTGNNRKAYNGEFQPRLGFSLDINADQRHVVFGGYGRSYDRDLYDYLQVEVTKAALPDYRCISQTRLAAPLPEAASARPSRRVGS